MCRGHKFDGLHNNWMLMNKYLALPFSYMSFIIAETHQQHKNLLQEDAFDLVPYNYMFNNNTGIIDLLLTQPSKVPYVLQNMAKLSTDNLCILNFTNMEIIEDRLDEEACKKLEEEAKMDPADLEKLRKKRNAMSALHIAFKNNDTPNVEVILKYMAESGENSSYNFRNIMHELLGY